jgi:hypothetical protein
MVIFSELVKSKEQLTGSEDMKNITIESKSKPISILSL